MIKPIVLIFLIAMQAAAFGQKNYDSSKVDLYFNQKGEWVNGFPDKIAKDVDSVKWVLPDNLDKRIIKKFNETKATVDKVNTPEEAKAFMRQHPLLLYVFINSNHQGLTISKDDTTGIVENFISYKESLKKYCDSLSSLKNFNKAKQSSGANNPYFPGTATDYAESFSVAAKNQYGKDIGTGRLKGMALKWVTDISITFSIYRELRDNQVIAAHYKTTYEKYQQVDWLFQRQKMLDLENTNLLNEVEKLITQWKQDTTLGETENAAVTLNRLIEKNDAVQNYISKTANFQKILVKENREWIKCWLWFTNWEPVMNPLELFGFTKDGRMKDLKKNIDSSKENISYLTKFIENKNIEKFSNFDEMKKATEQLAGMTVAVKQLETEYSKLEKEKKDLTEERNALKIEKQLVHVGELFGSDKKKWQPVRFHDYSKSLEIVNKTENNQYFWDGDDEKLIAVNVPAGVNVSLNEKIDAYVPKSFFSTLIDPVLDEFWKSVDGNLAGLQEQAQMLKPILINMSSNKTAIDALTVQGKITDAAIKEEDFKIATSKKEIKSINTAITKSTKELAKKNNEFSNALRNYDPLYNANIDLSNGNRSLLPTLDNIYVNDSVLKKHSEFKKYITQDINNKRSKVKEKQGQIKQYESKRAMLNVKIEEIKQKIAVLKADKDFISDEEINASRVKLNYDSINILKKWFSLQTNAFPPYDLSTPEDTVFRSLSLRPKEAIAAGNNKDTYTIYKRIGTAKEEKAASWNFKKYELKRLDAIAGLVFVNTDRSSLIYDATTQTFSSKDIGSSDVMLGIKFFPAGVWLEDKKFFGRGPCLKNIIRGTSFINRIAITGGVGVQKSPLRNFFTGFSYDIITGLSVNYGWNFYTKKDYDIKNGAIEKEYESFVRTPYWGITMAPATLLKVLKIINLKP